MKTWTIKLLSVLAAVLLAFHPSASAAPETFTPDERTKIAADIVDWTKEAQHNANFNKACDISFKIALFLIAVTATVGSAYAATYQDKPVPRLLKILNTSSTGVTTALTAFAFTQFNFAERQATWQKKADTLRSYAYILAYSDPKREDFLQRLGDVRGWNDATKPTTLPANAAPAKVPNPPKDEKQS